MKLAISCNRSHTAMWLIAALAACFIAYIARIHEVTHDLFHELALAREFWTTGKFPVDDVFAYSPTVTPAVHHEWGTGLVLYLATIESGLGVWGVTLTKSVLCILLWAILFSVARMRGAHPYVFAIASLAVFPFFWVGFATIRAQLFTLVCIAAQLWMQELDWRGRRGWVWIWLVMIVIWQNLHAGFLVGLCLMCMHGLERVLAIWLKERSTLAVLRGVTHLLMAAACLPVTLMLNPWGQDYVAYLWQAILMDRPTIAEWRPLWYTYDPLTTLLAFLLCVATFVYAMRRTSWRELTGLTNASICAWMALKHIRHGSIFGVVWLAYAPAWISRTPLGLGIVQLIDARPQATQRISQMVIAASFAFACWHQFWRPTVSGHCDYSVVCFPTGAVEYLKAHQWRGNVMTPFHVGAYVSWEMFPHVKVSLDGRYEVAFQSQVFTEHHQFYEAEPQWQEIVARYPSDAILINRDSKIAKPFEALVVDSDFASTELNLVTSKQEPGIRDGYRSGTEPQLNWQLVYQDDSYQLYARPSLRLPIVDHRGQKLPERAQETFSRANALRLFARGE